MESEVGEAAGEALPLEVPRRKRLGRSFQGRQLGRDVFVPPEPQNLLSKILGTGQVMAPGGGNHVDAFPIRLDEAAEPPQSLGRFRQGQPITCHTLQQGHSEPDCGALGGRGARGPGSGELRPAPGVEPFHQQVPGDAGHGGIRTPAEPMGRIRMQVVAPRGGAHGLGIEPGTLQQDAACGLGHLGAVAAHDTRQGDGTRFIRDEQVAAGHGAFDTVQGHQQFALPGPADGHGSVDAVRIEGVRGMAVAVKQFIRGIHRGQTLGRRLQGRQEGLYFAGRLARSQDEQGRAVDRAGRAVQVHLDHGLPLGGGGGG